MQKLSRTVLIGGWVPALNVVNDRLVLLVKDYLVLRILVITILPMDSDDKSKLC